MKPLTKLDVTRYTIHDTAWLQKNGFRLKSDGKKVYAVQDNLAPARGIANALGLAIAFWLFVLSFFLWV